MITSMLPWWGWLLGAVGSAICVLLSMVMAESEKTGWFGALLLPVAGLSTFACAVIGVIRFVKWAWAG